MYDLPNPDIPKSPGGGLLTERRTLLKWSSGALVGLLAFGGKLPGLSLEQAFAQTPGKPAMGKAVDLGEGDLGILNYAYALEHPEAAFYTQATKTPYADMASADRDILTGIRDHEVAPSATSNPFWSSACRRACVFMISVCSSEPWLIGPMPRARPS